MHVDAQPGAVERLFERFARRGDVAALGEVFDATAEELLRVAMALVREPAQADDLLQETFLSAIERAGRFEGGQRLVPWLLGILVNHARERRRQARRALDPERLERSIVQRPDDALLEREFEEELERAMGALSGRERSVLELYLKQGQGAAAIARRLGGSPGAVRMQIHRGLERLRQALPASLAPSSARPALGPGLAEVRARVLGAAAALSPSAPSNPIGKGAAHPAASSPAPLAVLMAKKSLAVLAAVLALSLVLAAWRIASRSQPPVRPVDVAAWTPAADATGAQEAPREVLPSEAAPSATERVAATTAAAASVPAAIATGGVRGRLLESDGRAASGIEVLLLELEVDTLLALDASAATAGLTRAVVGRSRSGEDGVFELVGARTRDVVQALGIDLGGERPSLRALGVTPRAGESVDLGDVVLAQTARLFGTVVDERGQPVAGARVRAGWVPEAALRAGLLALAPGGAIAYGSFEEPNVVELPTWLATIEELLPFASARTDAQGRFDMPHTGAGTVTVWADQPGRVAAALASMALAPNSQRDAGTIVLSSGRAWVARVVDEAGAAVPGALVRAAHAQDPSDGFALAGPEVRCDESGMARLSGLSAEGPTLLLARRDVHSNWVGVSCDQGAPAEVELRLPTAREWTLEVLDEAGAPVPAPAFQLVGIGRGMRLDLNPRTPIAARAAARSPGAWTISLGGAGPFQVAIAAAGHAPVLQVLKEGYPRVSVLLPRTQSREVRVVSAEDGRPLAGARVRLRGSLGVDVIALPTAVTGVDGAARVDAARSSSVPTWLHVERAGFAARCQAWNEAPPLDSGADPEPVVVALGRGASVVAHWRAPRGGGTVPTLQLQHHGDASHAEIHLPLLLAFDESGVARADLLSAGHWTWQAIEPLGGVEALTWVDSASGPRQFAEGAFDLVEGQEWTLDVRSQAATVGAGLGSAAVHGTLRIDGVEPRGVTMVLARTDDKSPREAERAPLLAGGFRFESLAAGEYVLVAVQDAAPDTGGMPQQLAMTRLTLAEGEARQIDLERQSSTLEVEVSGDTGQPVVGAEILAFSTEPDGELSSSSGRTDEQGRAHLKVCGRGTLRVEARHAEMGLAHQEVEVGEERSARLGLNLARGVPCRGLVRLAPNVAAPEYEVEMAFWPDGERFNCGRAKLTFRAGEAPFEVVGLEPGLYRAMAWFQDWTGAATFELGVGGATDLLLEFAQR